MLRTSLATIVVVLGLTTAAAAQDWAVKMFDATSHDFGVVAHGAKVQHRFTIRNLYKEDIKISGVRSSCGCTLPKVGKDLLKSRESTELVCEFDAQRFTGQRSATVTVSFEHPYYAEVQLQIRGMIRTDITVNPPTVNFGSVAVKAGGVKKLNISHAGRSDWKIVDVRSASDSLEAELSELSRNGGQVTYELLVRLRDDAPLGYVRCQLVVVTNDQSTKEFPIEVEGVVESEVSVSPSPLTLGQVKPGQNVAGKRLVVRGKRPFRILEIVSSDPGLVLQHSSESKTMHLVPVTFTAGDAIGRAVQKVTIKTDLGENVSPEVEVYFEVVAPDGQTAAN